MSKLHKSVLIILLGICIQAYAAGDVAVGRAKSEVCVACHNADGNSLTPIWPKIAGLSESYSLKQLLDFQKGQTGPRYDPTMYGIVQSLNQQDMEDLSAYYATQTMSIGQVPENQVALGQAIYRGGNLASQVPACAACHGPNGSGNSLAMFPRIGGQNSDYIIAQMNKFKNNTRSNDPNSIMRDIAAKMTDQEIQAVAIYVAGLH